MKITSLRTTPLYIPLKEPYHWANNVKERASVVLVEIETDEGVTGVGESTGWVTLEAVSGSIQGVASVFAGRDPHDVQPLMAEAQQRLFDAGQPTYRFVNKVLAGVEMAMWDVVGKAAGQPVHRLLGGAVHEQVGYFGFLQGDTAEELAEDAREVVAAGFPVVYMKIGRGREADMNNVAAVREAIGDRRLRLDANEAWDPLTAIRMIRALSRFDPEFIEQPTPAHSVEALAHVKESVSVPIAADQCAFTPADVYEVCRRRAADIIVLGVHETGGLLALKKAAAIAEAAGVKVCLHGVFETGITTCASNQVAATIPNLDDGNQIMWQILTDDLVASPSLVPERGKLQVSELPGLGFEIAMDVVDRAAALYKSGFSA